MISFVCSLLFNAFIMSACLQQFLIVQHTTIEEIQSYLDKFEVDFKPVYTAEEFVHVDDFEDTCKELTEEDLIHKHTKPHIEEEGSADEDDLENDIENIEISCLSVK
jgi:arginyl-tRNA synthetase